MNEFHWDTASVEMAGAVVSFALNFLAQSTVLILAGLLAARLLYRFGPSAQTAVYRATLVAVLACPALSAAFSGMGGFGWSLAIPSPWAEPTTSLVPEPATSPVPEPVHSNPFARNESFPAPSPVRFPTGPIVPVREPRFNGDNGRFDSAIPPAREAGEWQAIEEPSSQPLRTVSLFGWLALGCGLVWIASSLCLLIRLAWGWRRLERIRHTAGAIDDETSRACRQLAVLLEVPAPQVLQTPFLPGPCLAGIFQPVILMPEWDRPSAGKPQGGMRDILIHELAHLRRRDGLWNLLRQLATAVFFFQPLLWRLSRRMEINAEEACDDWVVALGADRQAYAHMLTDVAEWSAVPAGGIGVAMAAERSLLGQRVSRILDRSRPLSTRIGRPLAAGIAVSASTAVLLVGVASARPHRVAPQVADLNADRLAQALVENTHRPSPITRILPEPIDDGKPAPAIEKTADAVIVRGVVHKPDGKPAAGAKVALRYWVSTPHQDKLTAVTTVTQDDGKFTLSHPRARDNGVQKTQPESFDVTAQANGLGMQWVSSFDPSLELQAAQPLVLTLSPETPIHGRIVDTQGKPIKGVEVAVTAIAARKQGGDLKPWIEVVRAGGDNNAAHRKLDRLLYDVQELRGARLLTDQDGRFTITGLGSECVVDLALQGDAIAYQRVAIATRKMEPMTRTLWPHSGVHKPPIQDRVFGADFTYAAVPTQILEGTIRDAATKQPVPHAVVKSHHLAGMSLGPPNEEVVHTTSDAQGRYRLVGLPKGNGPEIADLNEIWVLPDGKAPYFKRAIRVPAAKGDGPQTLDIELHRGIWIHGRVTDKGTGQPVEARISYLPWRFNPQVRGLPEFHEDTAAVGFDGLTTLTDREGKYRLPGLPGQGVVTAWSIQANYLHDIGGDQVLGRDKEGLYPTIGLPMRGVQTEQFHAVKSIDPTGGADTSCDFILDPGETLQLAITDQEGKPVPGCTIVADRRMVGYHTSLSAVLDIANMTPGKPADLAIVHRERKLGKFVSFSWKQDGPRTIPVTLEPCATIKGKVVDEEGKPFPVLELVISPSKEVRVHLGYPMTYTNPDGSFEYAHAPAGCKDYTVSVLGGELPDTFAEIAKNVVVKAGQTVDLGTIKIKRKKSP